MTRRKQQYVSARLNMVRSVVHAINPRIPDIIAVELANAEARKEQAPRTVIFDTEERRGGSPKLAVTFPLQKEQPAMNQPSQTLKVQKPTIRKISQKDFFRLCEWINKNIPEGQEITHREIARQAGEDLKVEISDSSVPTALDAIGKTIRSPAGKGGSTPYKQSLGVLAEAVLALAAGKVPGGDLLVKLGKLAEGE